MPRNGSGSYSLPAGNPVVTGTTITSTWANTTLSDIGTALTGSIAADGQTTISANLPMSGYKHTNVAAATATTDYARYDQVQNSATQWLTSVSGVDTITATASPTLAAYAAGQTFRFTSAGANTGPATLNISSLGAKSITKNGTTALVAGDIPSGKVVTVTYDGTQFQLSSFYPSGSITLSGYNQSTSRVLGRTTASTGAIEELTLTEILDLVGSVAQGDILYRGASSWERLGAGTSGQFLKTQGTGANPAWASQRVVQIVEGTPYTTYASLTASIPLDDTIPQNTEGTEFVTVAITPTSASNRLVIEANIPVFCGAAGTDGITAALFQDSTANALTVTSQGTNSAGATRGNSLYLRYEMAAGTTSSTTFKLRIGATSGTVYINGSNSARYFGGVAGIRISVTEIGV